MHRRHRRFAFVDATRWAVAVDGAAALGSDGTLRFAHDHAGGSSARTVSLPQRPPWSVVMPRLASIHGRAGDDWTVVDVADTGEARLRATLSAGSYAGYVVVDVDRAVVVELGTPSRVADIERGLSAGERAALHASTGPTGAPGAVPQAWSERRPTGCTDVSGPAKHAQTTSAHPPAAVPWA